MSDEQAVMTAREMTEALNRTADELASANKYARRSRRMLWFTIVSLMLDIALTVVVTVALVASHSAEVTIGQLHANNVASCRAGNQTRAAEIGLWDTLYAGAEKTQHLTAAQKRADVAFLAYVRATFAPRNCNAEYRLP